jgi:hypothetical protein
MILSKPLSVSNRQVKRPPEARVCTPAPSSGWLFAGAERAGVQGDHVCQSPSGPGPASRSAHECGTRPTTWHECRESRRLALRPVQAVRRAGLGRRLRWRVGFRRVRDESPRSGPHRRSGGGPVASRIMIGRQCFVGRTTMRDQPYLRCEPGCDVSRVPARRKRPWSSVICDPDLPARVSGSRRNGGTGSAEASPQHGAGALAAAVLGG